MKDDDRTRTHPSCCTAINMPQNTKPSTNRNQKAIYEVGHMTTQQLCSMESTPNSAGIRAGKKESKRLLLTC